MGALRNPRQEAFCQNMAAWKRDPEGSGFSSQADCYAKAGYNAAHMASASAQAVKLMKKPGIQERIQEILDKGTKPNEITEGYVVEGLQRIEKLARDRGNFGAAVRSYELIGKQIGMFKETLPFQNLDHVLEGKSAEEIWNLTRALCMGLGFRLMDMNEDETFEFCERKIRKMPEERAIEFVRSLALHFGWQDLSWACATSGSPSDREDPDLPAIPEAAGVSPTRKH